MRNTLILRRLHNLNPGSLHRKQIPALLNILNVPWPKQKRINYLYGDMNLLWTLYERAEQAYKRLIRRFHSDSGRGNDKVAAVLNVAWKRLRMLFKRRGVERS